MSVKTVLCVLGGASLGAGAVYAFSRAQKAGFMGAADLGEEDVGIHLRQIRRYAFAASQDGSPVVGLTHAAYAHALLRALEKIAGPTIITKAGMSLARLRCFIADLDAQHARNLVACDIARDTVIMALGPRGIVGLGALLAPLANADGALGLHLRQIRLDALAAAGAKSPITGLRHASYALILLDTIEEVMGRDAVSKFGVDAKKLRAAVTKLQDLHAERVKKCDAHLQKILEIERREGMQIPGFVVAGAAPRGA